MKNKRYPKRRPKRNKKRDRHHRKPSSIGGTNDASNISIVRQSEHRAWHHLFANYDAETIASIINTYWLDPQYRFVVVARRSQELRKVS